MMEILFSAMLAISAGLLSIPVAIFFLETIAAILLFPRDLTQQKINIIRRRVAVLIPAHNEGQGLLPSLADVRAQLHPGDRVLVVADNCIDDTARVALAAGAEVVERDNSDQRGKGYALEFGVRHLACDPPAILIVIDADCRLREDVIEKLAMTCAVTNRPVQARYLMTAPAPSENMSRKVAEFAWRVKNWVRPIGLYNVGLPCQLMGSGMAFPWELLSKADLANGWLVEDLKLGLDLTAVGHPPVFCPTAIVTSQFASSTGGTISQRERWEQGHIKTILTSVPRLLFNALASRNWPLLAMTLDLGVPPLSLLGLLIAAMITLAGLAALFGFSPAALMISAVSFLSFLLAVLLAWLKYGRELLPPAVLLLMPWYAFRKLGLYLRILSNRIDARWIRTDRSKS